MAQAQAPSLDLLDFDILTNIIWILQSGKEAVSSSPYSRYTENSIYGKYHITCCRTLLSLALTCKTVSTPALRALWHRVDALVPVLKLIPQFSERAGTRPGRSKWLIDGSLQPSSHPDWSRFHYYANMIQKVCLYRTVNGKWHEEGMHHSVYPRIVDSFSRGGLSPGNPLFPNLMMLDTFMSPAMLLFQTSAPTLQHVRIRGTMRGAIRIDALTSRFIQDVLRLSQSRVLLLDGTTLPPAILLSVFNVSSLQHLHLSFAISDLAYQLIRVLDHEQLMLPNLKNLSIYCVDNRNEDSDKQLESKLPRLRLSLPNLQSLLLQGPLDGIAYLCKVIDSNGLDSVTLVSLAHQIPLEEASIHRDICDSLDRLSRRFPDPSVLKSLTFNFGLALTYLDIAHISSFSPIFAFENLTSLIFRQYALFIPSDNDLELMGKSLPNLQLLSIRSPPEQTPRATLRGVKTLIELCPDLQQLCVTFDASDPSTIPRIEPSSTNEGSSEDPAPISDINRHHFRSKVHTFDVGASLLEEVSVAPVGELLRWMFPDIKTLSYVAGRGDSINQEVMWSVVRNGLLLEDSMYTYS